MREQLHSTGGVARCLGLIGLTLAISSPPLGAQFPESLGVSLPDGSSSLLSISSDRGYPAIAVEDLGLLGWTIAEGAEGPSFALGHRTGLVLRFRAESPFIDWDGQLIHAAHAPYVSEGALHVPLQLLTDLFPGLLPDAYAFDEEQYLLWVEGATPTATPAPTAAPSTTSPVAAPEGTPLAPPWEASAGPPAQYVVFIDPGHGGDDLGAAGPSGLLEKDVALSVGLALARELAANPAIEVRLTRDRDIAVPVRTRGEWASSWRGERTGVLVSIHTNALPDRSGVRGFETYYLSEARTDHERLVAAMENGADDLAPEMDQTGAEVPDPRGNGVREGRWPRDHIERSARLADQVQRALSDFHPGADRGVRQAPLVVMAHAMMPAVVVQVGFITNPEEERLLARDVFHRDAARAIAGALESFLGDSTVGGP